MIHRYKIKGIKILLSNSQSVTILMSLPLLASTDWLPAILNVWLNNQLMVLPICRYRDNTLFIPLVFETCLKLGKLQCKYNFNRNWVLLLNFEIFETNQIVLNVPGGYMMHLETTWTPFWSPYTSFVPLSSPKLYKKIVYYQYCYLSHVTFQTELGT